MKKIKNYTDEFIDSILFEAYSSKYINNQNTAALKLDVLKQLQQWVIDIDKIHAAYDADINDLNLLSLFKDNGTLINKGTYGKIKAISNDELKKVLTALWVYEFNNRDSKFKTIYRSVDEFNKEMQYKQDMENSEQTVSAAVADANNNIKKITEEVISKLDTQVWNALQEITKKYNGVSLDLQIGCYDSRTGNYSFSRYGYGKEYTIKVPYVQFEITCDSLIASIEPHIHQGYINLLRGSVDCEKCTDTILPTVDEIASTINNKLHKYNTIENTSALVEIDTILHSFDEFFVQHPEAKDLLNKNICNLFYVTKDPSVIYCLSNNIRLKNVTLKHKLDSGFSLKPGSLFGFYKTTPSLRWHSEGNPVIFDWQELEAKGLTLIAQRCHSSSSGRSFDEVEEWWSWNDDATPDWFIEQNKLYAYNNDVAIQCQSHFVFYPWRQARRGNDFSNKYGFDSWGKYTYLCDSSD